MGDGHSAIDALVEYLERLHDEVTAAVAQGMSLEETQRKATDPWAAGLDPVLVEALAAYRVPQEIAQQKMLELCRNLHRLNVLAAYRLYSTGESIANEGY
jgi:cyclase